MAEIRLYMHLPRPLRQGRHSQGMAAIRCRHPVSVGAAAQRMHTIWRRSVMAGHVLQLLGQGTTGTSLGT
jgi:hypothetical protein